MATKKKISIITWLGEGNYGTTLQSYALHEKLQLKGYEVNYLHEFDRGFTYMCYVKWVLSILGVLEVKRKYRFSKSLKLRKIYKFHKSKYNSRRVIIRKEYENLLKNTDVFMSGSDQIWNTYFKFNPFFFLDFARDVRRVSYASSIGTNNIADDYKEEVRALLNDFTFIGVRENAGVEALSSLTGRRDILKVIDPTFLLESENWNKLADEAVLEFELPEKYILCYLIGKNRWYEKDLNRVKEKLNIDTVIIIPSEENPSFFIDGAIVYRDAGPVEFVDLIRKSEVVCTDSFHATALSINMSKEFVEFMRFIDSDKKSQNSRIYELLSQYRLENKLYSDQSDEWIQPASFEKVNEILVQDRILSMNYLLNSIES